jgi:hypothetical protein
VNIATIKPPSAELQTDFPNWNSTNDGNFSLKSAYSLIMDKTTTERNVSKLFQLVWEWRGPNRIRSFLWKVAHGRLMTNQERVKIGISNDDSCSRCQLGPETVMHVLRDCEEAREFWSQSFNHNIRQKISA